ncbi:hypothetical protein V1524DRAFT_265497 [Lipomyces starkeyi]
MNAVRLISSKEAESIRWLLFKVMHSLDNVGFSLFGQIPQIEAQSLYTCKLISDCAALSPVKYDCCHLRPCVCYFGEYEGYQVCPKCGAERFAKYSSKPSKLSHIFHLSQGSVPFLARSSYLR